MGRESPAWCPPWLLCHRGDFYSKGEAVRVFLCLSTKSGSLLRRGITNEEKESNSNWKCLKHCGVLVTVLDDSGTSSLIFRIHLVPNTVQLISVDYEVLLDCDNVALPSFFLDMEHSTNRWRAIVTEANRTREGLSVAPCWDLRIFPIKASSIMSCPPYY